MYDRFVQCPTCQNTTTTSRLVDGECPSCQEKNLTYGYAYLDERNQLLLSPLDLSVPAVTSFKRIKESL